jgi:hypothetical protein
VPPPAAAASAAAAAGLHADDDDEVKTRLASSKLTYVCWWVNVTLLLLSLMCDSV